MKLEQKIRAINIKWEGPLNLEGAYKKRDTEEDYGVYQVYGFHPVYGPNVLLYIGQSDDQTLGTRVKQHKWMRSFMETEEYTVYLGRLVGKSPETWSKEIDIAEDLLIFAHSPARNAQNVATVKEKKVHNYIVFNWANRGSLLPEVSGMRRTDKFWEGEDLDFEKLYR